MVAFIGCLFVLVVFHGRDEVIRVELPVVVILPFAEVCEVVRVHVESVVYGRSEWSALN